VDLEAVIDSEHVGDVGIPAGAELLAFTSAVELDDRDVGEARAALERAIGPDATRDAAATIAIFNGLVRVADGTGIQLDEGVFSASVDDRALLGLDRFAGAANSAGVTASAGDRRKVSTLFG
jgi:polygalacturonase